MDRFGKQEMAATGYVSEEDLVLLAENEDLGVAGTTTAACTWTTVITAASLAIGDACPTSVCTSRC